MTPSDQLFVFGSNLPYNWSEVIDFGFNLICWTLTKLLIPANEDILYAKTYVTLLFPENAAPTTIKPCLTLTVSKSWIHLLKNPY
jgi:hypothetical protein